MTNDIVSAYLSTWNAVDPHTPIGAVVAGVHEQFPGFEFTLVGEPDAHHDQVRFQWGLGPAGTEPPVIGFDVVTVDADRRIATVAGFLDRVPA
ncbi:nuclear transport factor 2 family protein [Tsukamurella spumae]|uniref:Nuclear transport factor 2 family protein n=1 Tax=Tsukamurella spumae TaxID=44753 RepID=A0A846X7D1_9ACTN|nr:nuclear transport factor 2 family protein [Tsukamurella spumae]